MGDIEALMYLSLTECGMVTFENTDIHKAIIKNLGVSAGGFDFQPFSE